MARPAVLPAHDRRSGGGRRRRLPHLREHLVRSAARRVRRGMARRGHVRGAQAALRHGGVFHERAEGPALPVDLPDEADERGGRGDRARGPFPAPRPGRFLRPRLELRAGRPARREEVEEVRQRAGRRAGHVRTPRQLRHRLRGRRPEHARPELHPPSREERRGGAPAPPRHEHPPGRRRLRRLLRRAERRGSGPRPGAGADRDRLRRIARVDRAAAQVPRGDRKPSGDRAASRPRLEQQRRLPDARAAHRPAPCLPRGDPRSRAP